MSSRAIALMLLVLLIPIPAAYAQDIDSELDRRCREGSS